MILNKKYMAFYKTWLSIFLVDVVLNILMYTYFIGNISKRELSKIGLDRIDRDKPLIEIQLVLYALVIAVMIFFILKSVRKVNRKSTGTLYGTMLGTVIFLTHNILNYSLLIHWTIPLVIVDASWGIVQGIVIGFLSVFLYDRFVK